MTLTDDIKDTLIAALRAADRHDTPYAHWLPRAILPPAVLETVQNLPHPSPRLNAPSGTREANNATRRYFDAAAMASDPVVAAVAEAFQSPEVIGVIEQVFGADLAGTRLRIEYAQDTDGFWLKPHTDIGVKKFTFLLYLSDGAGHDQLGTDIYSDADTHAGRSPFLPNTGLIFVPSTDTWHGFEPREIAGVRKSLIVNYVTRDWRAVEQLSYPDQPVKPAA